MPTKISLKLGNRRRLDRTTALGCLTTNLALPGFGTLIAGRVSGYAQVLLALTGMALTLIFGVPFIVWYLTNWSDLKSPEADPIETLHSVWIHVRWAVLGMTVFALGWLGALISSLRTLAEANAKPAPPPHLDPPPAGQ